ncbi:MAG: chromosomal replication initiator protein DnaA [Clostridia bacterium]|nr:chromosomal replication initiator protein DnaA [Clostridia bacterium]
MLDIKNLWKDACSTIIGLKGINAVSYSVWIDSLTPLCVKDNSLVLLAPSSNNKLTVNKNYKEAICDALVKTGSMITDVTIIIEQEKDLYEEEIKQYAEVTKEKPPIDTKSQFVSRYTFDNFVIGDSNNLAYHAALNVAQSPGVSNSTYLGFNPLFIYGGVGLGKTHLLHSIGNYIADNMPELKVLYTNSEQLINDFVSSLAANKMVAFRTKYRNVDVLMIDDIQFLQKRTGLQEAVFHIFNDLYQNGKQIVLTSDRPPKEIETLEDRLRSRFEAGLIADIGAPNLDMRIAIIRKKMMLEKIAVNDEVVYYIAEKCDSNIRELEGNLSRVVFYAKLKGLPCPDLEIAKEAMSHTSTKKQGVIDSQDIINATCNYFKVSKADIIGKKKTKDLAEARMIAIYLITDMLTIPLVSIGQLFGGRDHTTIIHARDKISSQLQENNPQTKRAIDDIKNMLKD